MIKQYATLEDTVYFWFAGNDTKGSGGDGASPAADVRLAGAAAGAAPVFSPTPVLLTNAGYPDGCYELAVAATDGNGFAANNTYAVFCTLAVDSQNPTGFVGSFDLKPILANTKQIKGVDATNAIRDAVATALINIGLDHLLSASVAGGDITDNSIIAKLVSKGATADWDDFVNATDSLQAIRDAIVAANPQNHAATANNESGNTTLDGGDFEDTATNDDLTYYQTGPGAAVGGFGLDCDLTFNIGVGRVPASLIVDGHFDSGAQRTVQVWMYNYITSAYVLLSNTATDFGNSGNDADHQYALNVDMVRVSDGEVKVRFTSTSTIITDVWNCDYVSISSVAQEAAGLTADAIQHAVWERTDNHIDHDRETLGHAVATLHTVDGLVVSATNAKQFIIDTGIANNDAFNGNAILIMDITDNHHEVRRIIDYIGNTKEVFVDRAFSFTPAVGDYVHISGASYADVNVTHVGGTPQTGRDIGANVLLSPGSGIGQLDITSGVVKSNLAQILGTALTETAGYIAAAFKKLFNVATPLLVASDVMRGTDGANETVPDAAGVVPTAVQNRQEMDSNSAGFNTIIAYVDELETRLTAVRAARLDADISSRSSHTAANVKTAIEAAGSHLTLINAKTANLPSGIAKNVALPSFDIYMVLSSNHVSVAIGKTVTGQIRKDGGSFADITNAITEVGSGWYTIADGLTQTEMNADKIILKFIADGCDQRGIEIFPT